MVRPHKLYRVLANAFDQSVVRRAASGLMDDAGAAASSVSHYQTAWLSRAEAQYRSRRSFRTPPRHNLSKDFNALQLGSAHRQKSQSSPPPSGGRVVWTIQLCRTRTFQLCAYIVCWRSIEMTV